MGQVIKIVAGLFALGMTCCGGAPFDTAPSGVWNCWDNPGDGGKTCINPSLAVPHDAPIAACSTFGGNITTGDDGGVIGATALASTEHTACFDAHCQQAATCADRTTALPVCVDYTNGGIMIGLWVCPVACCY